LLCQSGWHLATHQGIGEHARVGAVLWIAEGRGTQDAQDDKIAFTSARLVSQVGTLTQPIAVQWAAECAKRVLKHYEDKYPDDKRPREAIDAAIRWAKDPTQANRDAAAYAASAADAAASAADAAAYAADAYAAAADAYAARLAFGQAREKELKAMCEIVRANLQIHAVKENAARGFSSRSRRAMISGAARRH
jgi:hypothetical protein